MRYFFAGLMLMLASVFQLQAAAVKINGSAVLATVDGEAVTLGDVLRENSGNEALVRLYADDGKVNEEIAKLRKESVDRLIERKLLVAEFKRLNLALPQNYVESMIDDMAENLGCTSRSDLIAKLRSMNLNLEYLRNMARERLMAEMVVGREMYVKVVPPTPQELYEYFQAHEQEFVKPRRINLALLMLPADSEEKIVSELAGKLKNSPEAFSALVKAFSQGPNKEKGGEIGFVEEKNLREEFFKAITDKDDPVNKVYGPVKTAEGVYFLKVIAVEGGKKANFAEHREAIKNRLEKAERIKVREALLKKLRQQANIKYFTERSPEITGTENKTITTITEPVKAKEPVKKTTEKKIMVTLKTNYGDIKLELFADAAPKTVANFLEYVKSGFYKDTLFHRVIDNFMIQGGGFDKSFKQKATRAPIENEADNRLSNEIGTIAMARTMDPHSATAQFFINVANNDFLDFRSPSPQFYGYCVFGKVVEGMDVVNRIKEVKTGNRNGHQDVPKDDVVILDAVID